MTFNGDRFYSYGTVIANRVRLKGREAYVLDSCSFSSSTSKHQSYVRRAIQVGGGPKIFHVSCGKRGQYLDFTPQTLRDHYINAFKEISIQPPHRLQRINESRILMAQGKLSNALEVCEFFGIGGEAKIKKMIANIRDEVAKAAKNECARVVKEEADRKKREEKRMAEALAKDTENIPKWLAGENVYLTSLTPPMMRVEGEEVVTSLGARVPIDHCKRSLLFCFAMREKGWHRNGHTHHVGHYQIDSIDQTSVKAGCHVFNWSELERFGKQMNWI